LKKTKNVKNEVDVKPTSCEEILKTLKERGYNDLAIYSYACAARSWCEKETTPWKIWKEVEASFASLVPAKPVVKK
jgi:hypothetical protein